MNQVGTAPCMQHPQEDMLRSDRIRISGAQAAA